MTQWTLERDDECESYFIIHVLMCKERQFVQPSGLTVQSCNSFSDLCLLIGLLSL